MTGTDGIGVFSSRKRKRGRETKMVCRCRSKSSNRCDFWGPELDAARKDVGPSPNFHVFIWDLFVRAKYENSSSASGRTDVTTARKETKHHTYTHFPAMLSRLSAVRRLPRTFAAPVRMYSDNLGRTQGTVAQHKGFEYVAVCLFFRYLPNHVLPHFLL